MSRLNNDLLYREISGGEDTLPHGLKILLSRDLRVTTFHSQMCVPICPSSPAPESRQVDSEQTKDTVCSGSPARAGAQVVCT